MFWTILTDNLLFLYVAAFLLGVLCIEGISRIQKVGVRQVFIAVLSAGMLTWLDWRSCILLGLFSLAVFVLVKKKVPLQKHIYKVFLLLLCILIGIKDYWIFFDISKPYIPLGVSYYFFRLIAFLIEYSKKPDQFSEISARDFFSWVFFLPGFACWSDFTLSKFSRN